MASRTAPGTQAGGIGPAAPLRLNVRPGEGEAEGTEAGSGDQADVGGVEAIESGGDAQVRAVADGAGPAGEDVPDAVAAPARTLRLRRTAATPRTNPSGIAAAPATAPSSPAATAGTIAAAVNPPRPASTARRLGKSRGGRDSREHWDFGVADRSRKSAESFCLGWDFS